MAVSTVSFDLTGRVALLTGAAGGLGQCFARTLHAAGASVILCSRNLARPELVELSRELNAVKTGPTCECISVDVSSQSSVIGAFEELDKRSISPDVLVNNAGIALSGEAHRLDENTWNAVADTNLRGAWAMSQQFAGRLIEKNKPGSIINIASILGLQPSKGTAPYAITKAGLIQMTRALALEWARYNIRVNALSPGYVETDINRDFLRSEAGAEQVKKIPTRRIGNAEDLAGPLLLLASEAGHHMTGSNLVVDGGHGCMSL